jgi:hypothetical protein
MHNLPRPVPFALADYHMKKTALVNPHATGSRIARSIPLVTTKAQDLLNGKAVCGFHIGHAKLKVIELGQVAGGSKLVENTLRTNVMREKLRVMVAAFFGHSRMLCNPLTNRRVKLALAGLAGPDYAAPYFE